ncbi:MAG: hypothetical protein WC298_10545 [Sideroxydans sp.]|jgi:hypothetical protein
MRRFNIGKLLFLIVGGALSGAAYAGEAANFSMGVGLDYSSGKYGSSSTTETTSIPVHALYESGDWSLKMTVPYLFVTGDGSVIVSGGSGGRRGRSTIATTTTTARTTQSGLGDVVALANYYLVTSESGDSGLDVAGRIKFGTASETLGSGKNDYAAQLSTYTTFGDLSPSLMLGYEVLGSSAALPLDNVVYGSVGAGYAFSKQTHAGAEYWYAQRASATGYEQREVSLYANTRVGRDTYLRAYVMQGLSDGSPDNGYGLSLSAGF